MPNIGDKIKLLPANLDDFMDLWTNIHDGGVCTIMGEEKLLTWAQEDLDEYNRVLRYQNRGCVWYFSGVESEEPLTYEVSDDPGKDLEWCFAIPAKLVEFL